MSLVILNLFNAICNCLKKITSFFYRSFFTSDYLITNCKGKYCFLIYQIFRQDFCYKKKPSMIATDGS